MGAAEYCGAYAATLSATPIPLRRNTKLPLGKWKAATLEGTLTTLATNPGANIGLPIPAGFVVLDIDCHGVDGFDSLTALEAVHGALPATLTADTANMGVHFWYRLPDGATLGNSAGKLGEGLDSRGVGGYVVCEPSTIDGRAYRWRDWSPLDGEIPQIADLPAWVLDMLTADAPAKAPESPFLALLDESDTTPATDSPIYTQGQRNDAAFRKASSLSGVGLDEAEKLAAMLLWNNRVCSPPLSAAEVKTICHSASRYPPNPERQAKAPRGYHLLTGNDLANSPPMEWRIKGTLPRRGVGAISGPSGEGKSTLTIDMLHALAAGKSWFGYKSTPCPVIYCALEGQAGIAGRVAAYQAHHGRGGGNIRFILQPIDIRNADDRAALVQAILAAGLGGGVLAIDTLAQAAPGFEENSGKDMGEVVAAAQELQDAINGVVLLVAHLGKDTSKGLRGHSSLHAALDAVLEVRRTGDRREWFVAKSKDGAGDRAHGFRLEVVTIGADADGDPITACVIEPEACPQALKPPRGAWEIKTLEVATEMAGGGETVTLPALIEMAASRTLHDPTKRDRRKELTKRAIDDLCGKGHLTVIGEVVRLGAGNWFEPLADEDLI